MHFNSSVHGSSSEGTGVKKERPGGFKASVGEATQGSKLKKKKITNKTNNNKTFTFEMHVTPRSWAASLISQMQSSRAVANNILASARVQLHLPVPRVSIDWVGQTEDKHHVSKHLHWSQRCDHWQVKLLALMSSLVLKDARWLGHLVRVGQFYQHAKLFGTYPCLQNSATGWRSCNASDTVGWAELGLLEDPPPPPASHTLRHPETWAAFQCERARSNPLVNENVAGALLQKRSHFIQCEDV